MPDYITHVRERGYYGWPWYYMGDYEDPRHPASGPTLQARAIFLTCPSRPIRHPWLFLYTATTGPAVFPAEYRGNIFAAEHGSWNRATAQVAR